MEHDGCVGCKYESQNEDSQYCQGCKQNATDKYVKKTIADCIREMSDLELSNFIKSVHNDGTCREYAVSHGQAFTDMFGNKGVLAWLQSEVNE